MRIVVDISQIVFPGTGVASYTENLVKGLLARDKSNEYILMGYSYHNIRLLQQFYNKMKGINDQVKAKFLPLPSQLANFLWNRVHFFHLEKITGPVDIYHSSDWIQIPSQAKKITTVHDLVIFRYPQVSHPEIVQTHKRRLYWVKKECDIIIADSISTKNDLISFLGVTPSKIYVVYPGVSLDYYRRSPEEIARVRDRYNISGDYILTVGTNEPRKNLSKTISAFAKYLKHPLISSKKQPTELVIAGKAGWGRKIKEEKYVRVLGYVKETDLPALYSGALFFIYPSFFEGFGLPVIEAMACGCPVITSPKGSLREIVQDCALFVDPDLEDDIAVKMVKMTIDQNLHQGFIYNGIKNAKQFTWDNTVKQVLTLYNKK